MRPMIKLIVSDFDGTLLPYGQACLSHPLLALLDEVRDRGIILAVSSGRTMGELEQAFGKRVEGLWLIGCDGAYYGRDHRIVYERQIGHEELLLFDGFSHSNGGCVLHGAFANYSLGNLPQECDRFAATPIARVGEIKEKIFKVTTYGQKLRLPAYCGLRMHWDGGEYAMAQYVNRFCDKGAALSDLQARLMLTGFDTACIGDSGNDVAMMRGAKLSFCVGTRSEELMRVCNRQVENAEKALRLILSENGK